MKKQQLQTLAPASLYARVDGNRQSVDLSVAARIRVPNGYATADGCSLVREYEYGNTRAIA